MPISPTLRRAEPADLDTIVVFNRRMAAETEDIQLDADTVRRGGQAVLDDPGWGFYLVAEVDGRVVGQLMVTPEWSDWRNQWFWWIQSVYVIPEFRRKGLFAALFREVEKQAARRKDVAGIRLYVDENNWTAQETYKALGMQRSNYVMYEIES